MTLFSSDDLRVLRQLRAGFLAGAGRTGNYWRTEREVELYDQTFAQRIGWKWDAVLAELASRGWSPSGTRLLDWACGSGIAGRAVLSAGRAVLSAGGAFQSLTLFDRSTVAMQFAEKRARELHPTVLVRQAPTRLEVGLDTTLLISHVINELEPDALAKLLELCRKAGDVIWVEAGTHPDSRSLIAVREALAGAMLPVAPCVHSAQCGLLRKERAADWCHYFARVPDAVHRDGAWAHFAKDMGFDLRALPYSFLVLRNAALGAGAGKPYTDRVIGRPDEGKGHLRVLACRESGVASLMVQKRDVPEVFRALRDAFPPPVHAWITDDLRVLSVKETDD